MKGKIFLFLLIFIVTSTYANSPYKDVSKSSFYYKTLINLYKKAIMIGYPDKTFKPERTLTKFEYAKTLYNLLNYLKNKNVKLNSNELTNLRKIITDFADQLANFGVQVNKLDNEVKSLKKQLNNLKENNNSLKIKTAFRAFYNYREFDNNQNSNLKKIKGSFLYNKWTVKLIKNYKNVEMFAKIKYYYGNTDSPLLNYPDYLMQSPAASGFYTAGEHNGPSDAWINIKKFFKLGSLKLGRWKYKVGVDPIIYANRVDFAVEFKTNKSKEGINFKLAALNTKDNSPAVFYFDNATLNQSNTNMIFNAFYAQIDKKFNNKLNLAAWLYATRNENIASNDRVAPNFYGIEFKYPVTKKYNFTVFGNVIFEDADKSKLKQLFNFNTINADNLYKVGFSIGKSKWKLTSFLMQSDRNFGLNFTKDNLGRILSFIPTNHLRLHASIAGDDLFGNGYFVVDDSNNVVMYANYLSNADIKNVRLEEKLNDRLKCQFDWASFDMNDTTADSVYQYSHNVWQLLLKYKYSKSTSIKVRYTNYDFDKENGLKIARDWAQLTTQIDIKF